MFSGKSYSVPAGSLTDSGSSLDKGASNTDESPPASKILSSVGQEHATVEQNRDRKLTVAPATLSNEESTTSNVSSAGQEHASVGEKRDRKSATSSVRQEPVGRERDRKSAVAPAKLTNEKSTTSVSSSVGQDNATAGGERKRKSAAAQVRPLSDLEPEETNSRPWSPWSVVDKKSTYSGNEVFSASSGNYSSGSHSQWVNSERYRQRYGNSTSQSDTTRSHDDLGNREKRQREWTPWEKRTKESAASSSVISNTKVCKCHGKEDTRFASWMNNFERIYVCDDCKICCEYQNNRSIPYWGNYYNKTWTKVPIDEVERRSRLNKSDAVAMDSKKRTAFFFFQQ